MRFAPILAVATLACAEGSTVRLAVEESRWEDAAALYAELPGDAALSNRGACLFAAGELDEAEQIFRDLYARGHPRAAVRLAMVLRDKEDLASALTCAQEGDDEGELADCYRSLGMIEQEIALRARSIRTPCGLYNFAAALAETDADAAAPLFSEVLARCGPGDSFVEAHALNALETIYGD